jgi:ABC-type lipoprotein export system ATPase subunit
MLKIRQLEKAYPNPAEPGGKLTVLSLQQLVIEDGERVGLAGPSGSGKTTLLHLIAGLTAPSAGEIWVYGQAVHRMKESERDEYRARTVGILFQTFNLLPGFSTLENVKLAMSFSSKIPTTERTGRAKELLEQVGLAHRLHHRPHQLSTGQQQRVALARALANRPHLLLADEPTASIDHRTAQTVMDLLLNCCDYNDATLLVASHDPHVLERLPRQIELNLQGQLAREATNLKELRKV